MIALGGKKIVIIIVLVVILLFFVYWMFFKTKAPVTTNTNNTDQSNNINIDAPTNLTGNPSVREIILMGDKTISWSRLYQLGTKYNLTKEQIDLIVKNGRSTFDTNVLPKFPNWKDMIKSIVESYSIEFKDRD